jgi:hypothetical protein
MTDDPTSQTVFSDDEMDVTYRYPIHRAHFESGPPVLTLHDEFGYLVAQYTGKQAVDPVLIVQQPSRVGPDERLIVSPTANSVTCEPEAMPLPCVSQRSL